MKELLLSFWKWLNGIKLKEQNNVTASMPCSSKTLCWLCAWTKRRISWGLQHFTTTILHQTLLITTTKPLDHSNSPSTNSQPLPCSTSPSAYSWPATTWCIHMAFCTSLSLFTLYYVQPNWLLMHFFSFFLDSQKFTPYVLYSLVLLTMSASLLELMQIPKYYH